MMPVFAIRRSCRNLQKLAGCVIGRPMYSSRWKSSTFFQSMPGAVVNASRNSNCDAALAPIIRALPCCVIARRIASTPCTAAAFPKEFLSSSTLIRMGTPLRDECNKKKDVKSIQSLDMIPACVMFFLRNRKKDDIPNDLEATLSQHGKPKKTAIHSPRPHLQFQNSI